MIEWLHKIDSDSLRSIRLQERDASYILYLSIHFVLIRLTICRFIDRVAVARFSHIIIYETPLRVNEFFSFHDLTSFLTHMNE